MALEHDVTCVALEHDVTCVALEHRLEPLSFVLSYVLYIVKAAIIPNRRERPRALAVNKLSLSYIILQHQIKNICNGIIIN